MGSVMGSENHLVLVGASQEETVCVFSSLGHFQGLWQHSNDVRLACYALWYAHSSPEALHNPGISGPVRGLTMSIGNQNAALNCTAWQERDSCTLRHIETASEQHSGAISMTSLASP